MADANLTVWKFPTPEGADEALAKLEALQKRELIQVHDAAIVSWPADKKKPNTKETTLTGAGAAWGGLWGMLFGLIFFVPLLGLAVGAGMGALMGHFAKVGIDEDFINAVREKVTPGTSALFLLSSGGVADKIRPEFQGTDMELIESNLSTEQEEALRTAFAPE